jgi:hypothetical protein
MQSLTNLIAKLLNWKCINVRFTDTPYLSSPGIANRYIFIKVNGTETISRMNPIIGSIKRLSGVSAGVRKEKGISSKEQGSVRK